MDCSTPGFPVLHCLLEFAQTHVHWVGNAIQPSHPLSPPSLPVLNLSQHQGLSQWVGSLHHVAKVLELQLQYQSFWWILISFRIDSLDLLEVQGTPKSLLQHHNSKSSGLQHSALFWSTSHIHTFPVSPDISSESFSTEESRKLSPIDQSEKVLCYPWHIAFRSFFSYSTSTNLFGDLQEE